MYVFQQVLNDVEAAKSRKSVDPKLIPVVRHISLLSKRILKSIENLVSPVCKPTKP